MVRRAVMRSREGGERRAMVVALDDQTSAWLKDRDVPRYTKKLVSRTGSTDNHATSGLKFKVLVDFLTIGCSVLLSDVDVLWMTNPFPHLYRDTDVEGMSDCLDEKTAFGNKAGGGTVQLHARNSGMFFLLATRQSLAMVRRRGRGTMASFSDTPDISDAAVAEGPEEVESMVDLPSVTLEIFNVVKSSHAQHGLRHGDYTRYRQYCSRRLRRIRKTLGMQHGKGRFVRRATPLARPSAASTAHRCSVPQTVSYTHLTLPTKA